MAATPWRRLLSFLTTEAETPSARATLSVFGACRPRGLEIFLATTSVCPCNTKAALDNISPKSMALLQEVFVYKSERVTWPSGGAWLAPAAHGAFTHHFHVNCYLVASPNTTLHTIFCEFFFFNLFPFAPPQWKIHQGRDYAYSPIASSAYRTKLDLW